MKLFNKVAAIAVGVALATGVGAGIVAGSKASREIYPAFAASTEDYTLVPNNENTELDNTAYITTLTEFTYSGVTWKMNQWNPSTLQIKTNQSSPASEFRFYNTSAFAGRITKVVMTFSQLTLSNESTTGFMFVGGSSTVTATSGGTNGTWNSTKKTITWTPGSSDNFTYFAFYQNGKVATSTNKLATANSIVVTHEVPSGPSLSITGSAYVVDGGSAGTIAGTITNNNNYTITWSSSDNSHVSFSPTTSTSGQNVNVTFNGVTTGTTPIVITGTLNDANTTSESKNVYALEHAGTSADPFTATDAMVFSHTSYAAQSGGDWYVQGYVVGAANTNKGYYIDEDSTATSAPYKFELYNSSGVTNNTGKDIIIGTSYVIGHGSMTYYVNGSIAQTTGSIITSVDNGSVPSVVITEGDQSIFMGDPLTFHATTENPSDATVTWTSSDTGVATIGSSTGVVTTVGGGSTTITATITVDAVNYTDEVTLTVTAPLLKSGDSVIFYSGENYLTDINTSGNTHYGNRTTTKSEAIVYTVETGSVANSFAFVNSGNYLTWSSGNSLDYASSVNANSSWEIIGESLTSCTIANANTTARHLRYNSGSPRFACYESGQSAVSIEKVTVADPTTLTMNTKAMSLGSEEVAQEALTFTTDSPSAAFVWYSENTSLATVSNGVVTAGSHIDVTVKIYVYFDSDGSGDFDSAKDLNDYCTVTITAPVIDYSSVTYGGTGVKVTEQNASTLLVDGAKIILTHGDDEVAGAFAKFMLPSTESVSFSNSTVTIGDGTEQLDSFTIFELEASSHGFYLKMKNGKYLSNASTASKAGDLTSTDVGSVEWVVSEDGIYDYENEDYATIMYNTTANQHRFKTYAKSFASGDPVVVYSFVEYVDEAETYAANFMNSGLCGANDNTKASSSIWLQQRTAFLALSAGAQNVLKTATENASSPDAIQECLARYDRVIYLHYGSEPEAYPDFMNRVANHYVTPLSNTRGIAGFENGGTAAAMVVVVVSAVSVTAIGGFFLLKKKPF